MQFQTCFLLFVSFAGVVDASEVTPIQKVVTLLTGMAAKGAKERSEEQDTFATSSEFCRTTQRDKTVAISDSTDKIESLKASIQKDGTEVARLSREMASLNTDEDGWNGDIKAANNVRAADKALRDDAQGPHRIYQCSWACCFRHVEADEGSRAIVRPGVCFAESGPRPLGGKEDT